MPTQFSRPATVKQIPVQKDLEAARTYLASPNDLEPRQVDEVA